MIAKNLITLAAVARRLDIYPALARELMDKEVLTPDGRAGRYFLFKEERVSELGAAARRHLASQHKEVATV
jgi:hypothetical protein